MPEPKERDSLAGCYNAANFLENGLSVTADPVAAATEYARVCAEGEAWSCAHHGWNQVHGSNGIALNREAGIENLRRSCDEFQITWACERQAELAAAE